MLWDAPPWTSMDMFQVLTSPPVPRRWRAPAMWCGCASTLCATVRVDLNLNWVLKVENHSLRGTSMLPDAYNQSEPSRDWNLTAVKLSYLF